MRRHWWKILAVLILAYVIIAGLASPLFPGISDATPSRIDAGELVVMNITGYNTNFDRENDVPRAWLKLDDDHALGATQVQARNANTLRASFFIPDYFPNDQEVSELTLVLDSKIDGYSTLPSALFVRHKENGSETEAGLWKKDPIVHLNERSKYGFPFRNILVETIRNVYFHVPMWFGMILLFMGSVYFGYRYTKSGDLDHDRKSVSLLHVGIIFGLVGLVTGMIWAKYTWGQYWSWDIKQNMSAITLLIYLALLVLRGSFDDEQRRARMSAGYNLFAFVLMIPLIFVIPRLTDSLHPGNGGNPALGSEDMDNTMRMIFYPAVIGWTLLGVWMAQLSYRFFRVKDRIES